MKLSQAKKALPFIAAVAEGKTIQKFNGGKWYDCHPTVSDLSFRHPAEEYRIKPEPKLRPWKPEEVPVGCLTRGIGCKGFAAMIVGVTPDKVVTAGWEKNVGESFETVLKENEHSTDHGATWQPCGVIE